MDEFAARLAEQTGRRVRRRRRAIEMSQPDLARRAGVSRSVIAMVEAGNRVARVDSLVRLAGGLIVSPSQLLTGIEWEVEELWLPARLADFEEDRPDA